MINRDKYDVVGSVALELGFALFVANIVLAVVTYANIERSPFAVTPFWIVCFLIAFALTQKPRRFTADIFSKKLTFTTPRNVEIALICDDVCQETIKIAVRNKRWTRYKKVAVLEKTGSFIEVYPSKYLTLLHLDGHYLQDAVATALYGGETIKVKPVGSINQLVDINICT